MSSKLNAVVRYAYMRGGAAWGILMGKADMVFLHDTCKCSFIAELFLTHSRRAAIN